jgi:hypothetical protein
VSTFRGVVPDVLVQRFEAGDSCTGVAYTGLSAGNRTVAVGHPLNARVWLDDKSGAEPGAIDGGLFDLEAILGGSIFPQLEAVWISLPGVTAITLSAVSEDGSEFTIASVSASQMVIGQPSSWLLLPRWKLKVVATGALTGQGGIYLTLPPWTKPYSFSTYTP